VRTAGIMPYIDELGIETRGEPVTAGMQ
jgi:hypothetical protein